MIESFLRQLELLFKNPAFLACIISWFSTQFIKTVIKLFAGQVASLRDLFALLLWRTGGMPSSHTAFVATLCTGIGCRSGMSSALCSLALGFGVKEVHGHKPAEVLFGCFWGVAIGVAFSVL